MHNEEWINGAQAGPLRSSQVPERGGRVGHDPRHPGPGWPRTRPRDPARSGRCRQSRRGKLGPACGCLDPDLDVRNEPHRRGQQHAAGDRHRRWKPKPDQRDDEHDQRREGEPEQGVQRLLTEPGLGVGPQQRELSDRHPGEPAVTDAAFQRPAQPSLNAGAAACPPWRREWRPRPGARRSRGTRPPGWPRWRAGRTRARRPGPIAVRSTAAASARVVTLRRARVAASTATVPVASSAVSGSAYGRHVGRRSAPRVRARRASDIAGPADACWGSGGAGAGVPFPAAGLSVCLSMDFHVGPRRLTLKGRKSRTCPSHYDLLPLDYDLWSVEGTA